MRKKIRRWNYKVYTLACAIGSFIGGLFGPFYLLFIQKIGGGIESFGIALGIMMLAESITSFFAGKYSDKFGRKPFFIASGYISSIIVLFYTIISQRWQLYLLQLAMGINNSIANITHTAFMGDITEKSTRGHNIGRFNAIIGALGAIAMILGGFVVGRFGFKAIFYITAIVSAITTTFLFKLKE